MAESTIKMIQNLSLNPPHQKAGFDNLPADLLNMILDYLPWKGWMWSMQLVSKKFHIVTLPRLYKKFVFSIDHPTNRTTAGMLSNTNRGLAFVRELEIKDSFKISFEYRQEEAMLILYSLPRDILKIFRWNSRTVLPANMVSVLWTRQRMLENIEIMPYFTSIDQFFWVNGQPISNGMDNINSLSIRSTSLRVPEAAIFLLKNKPKIASLVLNFRLWGSAAGSVGDNRCRILFGIPESLEAPTRFALQNLELHNVNLQSSSESIVAALEFGKLKSLTISRCMRPDIFLAGLVQNASQRPPRLETLKIYHAPGALDYIVEALNNLLDSSDSCLINLWITLRTDEKLPKVTSISAHASTLKTLYVDVQSKTRPTSNNNGHAVYYNAGDWKLLCNNLHNLEQLAAVFPDFDISYPYKNYPQFFQYLKYTSRIPHLKTLNITTFPSDLITSHPRHRLRLIEYMVEFRREHSVERFATGDTAFEALDVVALGRTEPVMMKYFVKLCGWIKAIEMYPPLPVGGTAIMQPVTLEELQKHQKPVDVVEWGIEP